MSKVVGIGNCQISGIRDILEQYTNFKDKYVFQQFANWQMIENKEAPPIESIKNADVIIYQPLSDVHGCFSTNPDNPNNMLQFAKSDAIIISMPRMYNDSLWPVFAKRYAKNFYCGDEYLRDFNGASKNTILTMYDNKHINFYFPERFSKNMDISYSKEINTDVKVVKFICDNIKQSQLFLTPDHPTTLLFRHCVDQMLDHLHVSYTQSIDNLPDNLSLIEESTYQLPTRRLPQSSFSTKSFHYEWDHKIDDLFYRKTLSDHLDFIKRH